MSGGLNYEAELGTRILSVALTEETEQVYAGLGELTDHTTDRERIGVIAAAWIDATLAAIGVTDGTLVEVTSAAGGLGDLDELEPDIAWTVRAIAARTVGAELIWEALLLDLPADADGIQSYLARLLHTISNTLHRFHQAAFASARSAEVVARAGQKDWPERADALRANAAFN